MYLPDINKMISFANVFATYLDIKRHDLGQSLIDLINRRVLPAKT